MEEREKRVEKKKYSNCRLTAALRTTRTGQEAVLPHFA
jgi:hypothetical protein